MSKLHNVITVLLIIAKKKQKSVRIIYEAQTLCTVPCCTREVGDSTLGLPETM